VCSSDLRTPDAFASEDLLIRSWPVAHIAGSIGYRVETPGGSSVAYSGDTDLCEGLVELARGADLFLCECSLPDEMKVEGHLSLAEDLMRIGI
jgi:ribonuclease BN (tRNA processing enzyme)